MAQQHPLCSKPVAIFERNRKTPEQILEFLAAEQDWPESRQKAGKARAGSRHRYIGSLLTALLLVGLWAVPGLAEECDESCTPCHGSFEVIHDNFNHTAIPGSGPVGIFPDSGHDNGGWVGERPYFDVIVDCTLCHATELATIHGQDCATCHPTPYDTLETWNGGCQQGGCHSGYHTDSDTAHAPFENAYAGTSTNDCSRCHDQTWSVPQSKCLNCHAAAGPGDVTPPLTTSNALTEYVGPAEIHFSITDNGKVGTGRTFYRLDGGLQTAAGKSLLVTAPGQHELEFWSMDQAGNTEATHNQAAFTIVADTTAPTTTADAQPTYQQGGVITLTANDDSTQGVKTIYYRLGSGPVQTGARVTLPTASGIIGYTLYFWADDWSGNTENENSVSFTVISGSGTIRLVWGNSDVSGSPCSGDPEAAARWNIYLAGSNTPLKVGSGACPGWSGVADIGVPLNTTAYKVIIDWYDSSMEDWGQSSFLNVQVTTSGQVVRLGY